MTITAHNRHWCQPEYGTTCLASALRVEAGLESKTSVQYLAERYESRGGLYFANPYMVDWALAWALQGVASATALRERLASDILASVNEDGSFGRYDVPVSTALAILALTSLGVGGEVVRRARLRLADLMMPDGSWPLSTPFYSAVKIPRELLPGGMVARLMLGERQGQLLWLDGGVYAVSLYVDGYRTISSALASLALMYHDPSADRDALPMRRRESCHPRYRCADHIQYIAGYALPPYLVSIFLFSTFFSPLTTSSTIPSAPPYSREAGTHTLYRSIACPASTPTCATRKKRRPGGYTLRFMSESAERNVPLALMVQAPDEPGALHALTGVLLDHEANIAHVDIAERRDGLSTVYFELEDVEAEAAEVLVADLEALPIVRVVERAPSFQKVYGKRIIVVGGGAQVGQVVVGAVAEADRHNIRGEKISVDTIPLVGEGELAAATRAVARLPRAVALVLAGALMGGEVARAVREIREKGIIVLSLNMPGSVPAAADLVVSDPVQCGVMAVMAVSDSASFDIARQRGRRY